MALGATSCFSWYGASPTGRGTSRLLGTLLACWACLQSWRPLSMIQAASNGSIWIAIATCFRLQPEVIYMDRLENQGEQAEARAIDQTRLAKTSAALTDQYVTNKRTKGNSFRINLTPPSIA